MPKPYDPSLLSATDTFGLTMTDDALVTFGPPTSTGPSFTDVGFMPVTAVTIGGQALDALPGNHGKLFISYTGHGTQAGGDVNYSDLHYDLIEYNGAGKFGHAADGTPTAKGIGNPVVIAHGELIDGKLSFDQSGGISGTLNTTLTSAVQTGTLAITVQHAATDIRFGAGTIQLDGGHLTATFMPAIA